ncbi:hypothetical protein GJAV_G00027700 [Gymnothorax javanicus]|nr:hypothetical protein GJAV_G00027700 [Gymnothorax javanicus]
MGRWSGLWPLAAPPCSTWMCRSATAWPLWGCSLSPISLVGATLAWASAASWPGTSALGRRRKTEPGWQSFFLLTLPLLARAALEDLGRACCIIARREFAHSDDFAIRAGVPSLGEVWGRRVRGEIGGEREEISNGGEEEEWVTSESEDEEVMEDDGGAVGGNEGRMVSVSEGLSGEGEVSTEKRLTLSLQDAQGVSCGALKELGLVCPDLHSLALIGEEQEGLLATPAMAQWAGQMHNLSLQLAGDLYEVLSVIQAVGDSLTSLTLEGIRIEGNASFVQLLRSCPKLRTLHIHAESPSRAEEEDEDEEEEEDIAANLRDVPSVPLLQCLKLNFFLEQGQTKPAMSWRALKWPLAVLLAGSPLLEKVSLSALPCPLDDVFHLVCSRSLLPSEPIPLQRLHDLSMTRCDISDGTVMRLVSSANCLSSLDLSGCWPVTLKCIGQLQKIAIRRQCPLTVVWV